MSNHLIDIVQQLGSPRVLVLGDLILDRYVWGDADRISQEAPVILLREERQEVRLGGAANVAHMLHGLEAHVTMAGIVGGDGDGQDVRTLLEASGVNCEPLLTDTTRPTTVKVRFIGRAQHRHPHQMLRVDREVRTPLSAELAKQLLDRLLPLIGQHDAVLISDYAKGVCTPEVSQAVIQAARKLNIPVIVDPSSSGDCSMFVGATAVTPNRLETKRATGIEVVQPRDAYAAGRDLCERFKLDYAFVTIDSDGIVLVRSKGEAEHLSTRKREVYDITGAGDMVLATIGVGAAAGVDPADLARLANIAGGLEVEQIGVVPISREQILADLVAGSRDVGDKVCSLDALSRHVAARKKLGQKIVFTNGCFDMLHVGHVTYLREAAALGSCLIVAVNSDSSVRRLEKGSERPIFPQEQRAAMLAALQAVDYVIVFDDATPHSLLETLKPDVLVKGGTYAKKEIVGWEIVESYGGEVRALSVVPGISTTKIVERLRSTIPMGSPAPAERKAA